MSSLSITHANRPVRRSSHQSPTDDAPSRLSSDKLLDAVMSSISITLALGLLATALDRALAMSIPSIAFDVETPSMPSIALRCRLPPSPSSNAQPGRTVETHPRLLIGCLANLSCPTRLRTRSRAGSRRTRLNMAVDAPAPGHRTRLRPQVPPAEYGLLPHPPYHPYRESHLTAA